MQDAQRQNYVLNKSLFNFKNCRSKVSNAAFYTGFESWGSLMAVFEYLDPGQKTRSSLYQGGLKVRISAGLHSRNATRLVI